MNVRGTPGKGLFGTTAGFFFGFAAVALYGPTAIKFKEAMDLSPTLVGLLIAIPSLSGSLLRIPFGAWADTTGGKKPFLILLILSLIGLGGVTFLLSTSYPGGMKNMFPLVLLCGFLSGCGIATFSVGAGQTSYWYPRRRQGIALGIFGGLGNLAPGIFSLVLPLFLIHYGFISAYFAWFLFLLSGTVLYAIVGVDAPYFQFRKTGMSKQEARKEAETAGQEIFPAGNISESLTSSARIRNTWALVILYFTSFGGFIALTAWFPTYWSEYQGFAPVKAGLFTSVFSIMASLVRVYGGKVADRLGGEKAVLTGISVFLLTTVILSLAPSIVISLVSVIMLAAGIGLSNAAVFKLLPVYIPGAVGGAAGWIGGLGAFGGFVMPPLMGAVAGHYGRIGYARGFFVFVILCIIDLLIIYFLIKNKRKISD